MPPEMRTTIAQGNDETRWQQAGEWRVKAVFPTGSTPTWADRPCRHQRRGRRLPDPGSQTGTRHHSAIGYRDPLPGGRIAQCHPCSPPSASPRGLQGFPSNFPQSGGCCGRPTFDAFCLDKPITKRPGFAL